LVWNNTTDDKEEVHLEVHQEEKVHQEDEVRPEEDIQQEVHHEEIGDVCDMYEDDI
jgi:hypothetical protein